MTRPTRPPRPARPEASEVVERLVELAREDPPKHLTPREWAGLHRLERSLLVGRRRGSTLVVAAAAVLVAAALALWLRVRDHAVTYEIVNGTVSEGGYVATTDTEASLRFSDRSEVAVAPLARVRVSRLEVNGARVMLESGTLHVRIHPGPGAAWTFDAGPYVVHVTGTEFDLAWNVEEQALDLRLRKGSVIVDGPLVDAGVRVGAGQHLVANGKAGTLSLVDELNGHVVASAAPSSAPPSVPDEGTSAPLDAPSTAIPRNVSASASAVPRGHAEAPNWAARVARGDFDGVIADAEHRGLDKALNESPVADLAALADAARYARRQDLARRALAALRARYGGSVQARDAPFFLGGLAESATGSGDDAAAIEWYDIYLRENADGAYASQVLGRKMMLVQRSRGPDGARAIAREYLVRFPDGPYAASANKLSHAQ
jgi:FecR protein